MPTDEKQHIHEETVSAIDENRPDSALSDPEKISEAESHITTQAADLRAQLRHALEALPGIHADADTVQELEKIKAEMTSIENSFLARFGKFVSDPKQWLKDRKNEKLAIPDNPEVVVQLHKLNERLAVCVAESKKFIQKSLQYLKEAGRLYTKAAKKEGGAIETEQRIFQEHTLRLIQKCIEQKDLYSALKIWEAAEDKSETVTRPLVEAFFVQTLSNADIHIDPSSDTTLATYCYYHDKYTECYHKLLDSLGLNFKNEAKKYQKTIIESYFTNIDSRFKNKDYNLLRRLSTLGDSARETILSAWDAGATECEDLLKYDAYNGLIYLLYGLKWDNALGTGVVKKLIYIYEKIPYSEGRALDVFQTISPEESIEEITATITLVHGEQFSREDTIIIRENASILKACMAVYGDDFLTWRRYGSRIQDFNKIEDKTKLNSPELLAFARQMTQEEKKFISDPRTLVESIVELRNLYTFGECFPKEFRKEIFGICVLDTTKRFQTVVDGAKKINQDQAKNFLNYAKMGFVSTLTFENFFSIIHFFEGGSYSHIVKSTEQYVKAHPDAVHTCLERLPIFLVEGDEKYANICDSLSIVQSGHDSYYTNGHLTKRTLQREVKIYNFFVNLYQRCQEDITEEKLHFVFPKSRHRQILLQIFQGGIVREKEMGNKMMDLPLLEGELHDIEYIFESSFHHEPFKRFTTMSEEKRQAVLEFLDFYHKNGHIAEQEVNNIIDVAQAEDCQNLVDFLKMNPSMQGSLDTIAFFAKRPDAYYLLSECRVSHDVNERKKYFDKVVALIDAGLPKQFIPTTEKNYNDRILDPELLFRWGPATLVRLANMAVSEFPNVSLLDLLTVYSKYLPEQAKRIFTYRNLQKASEVGYVYESPSKKTLEIFRERKAFLLEQVPEEALIAKKYFYKDLSSISDEDWQYLTEHPNFVQRFFASEAAHPSFEVARIFGENLLDNSIILNGDLGDIDTQREDVMQIVDFIVENFDSWPDHNEHDIVYRLAKVKQEHPQCFDEDIVQKIGLENVGDFFQLKASQVDQVLYFVKMVSLDKTRDIGGLVKNLSHMTYEAMNALVELCKKDSLTPTKYILAQCKDSLSQTPFDVEFFESQLNAVTSSEELNPYQQEKFFARIPQAFRQTAPVLTSIIVEKYSKTKDETKEQVFLVYTHITPETAQILENMFIKMDSFTRYRLPLIEPEIFSHENLKHLFDILQFSLDQAEKFYRMSVSEQREVLNMCDSLVTQNFTQNQEFLSVWPLSVELIELAKNVELTQKVRALRSQMLEIPNMSNSTLGNLVHLVSLQGDVFLTRLQQNTLLPIKGTDFGAMAIFAPAEEALMLQLFENTGELDIRQFLRSLHAVPREFRLSVVKENVSRSRIGWNIMKEGTLLRDDFGFTDEDINAVLKQLFIDQVVQMRNADKSPALSTEHFTYLLSIKGYPQSTEGVCLSLLRNPPADFGTLLPHMLATTELAGAMKNVGIAFFPFEQLFQYPQMQEYLIKNALETCMQLLEKEEIKFSLEQWTILIIQSIAKNGTREHVVQFLNFYDSKKDEQALDLSFDQIFDKYITEKGSLEFLDTSSKKQFQPVLLKYAESFQKRVAHLLESAPEDATWIHVAQQLPVSIVRDFAASFEGRIAKFEVQNGAGIANVLRKCFASKENFQYDWGQVTSLLDKLSQGYESLKSNDYAKYDAEQKRASLHFIVGSQEAIGNKNLRYKLQNEYVTTPVVFDTTTLSSFSLAMVPSLGLLKGQYKMTDDQLKDMEQTWFTGQVLKKQSDCDRFNYFLVQGMSESENTMRKFLTSSSTLMKEIPNAKKKFLDISQYLRSLGYLNKGFKDDLQTSMYFLDEQVEMYAGLQNARKNEWTEAFNQEIKEVEVSLATLTDPKQVAKAQEKLKKKQSQLDRGPEAIQLSQWKKAATEKITKNIDAHLAMYKEMLPKVFSERCGVELTPEEVNKFLEKFKDPSLVFIYMGGLGEFPEQKALFAQYIKAVAQGNLSQVRYEYRVHLETVFAGEERMEKLWKMNSRLTVKESKEQGDELSLEASTKQRVKGFITEAIGHGHVDGAFKEQMETYLNASDMDKQRMKVELTKQVAEFNEDTDRTAEEKIILAILNTIKLFNLKQSEIKEGKIREKKGDKTVETQLASILQIMKNAFETDSPFQNDIEAISLVLQEATKKAEVQNTAGYRAEESEDPDSLLRMGTDVVGSCQNVNGSPSLNRNLVSYIMDGKIKTIFVRDSGGEIVSRAVMRILYNTNAKKPVINLEHTYHRADAPTGTSNSLIFELAKEKAKKMGVELTISGKYHANQKLKSYTGDLTSLGGPGATEYVDSFGGQHLYQKYTIPGHLLYTIDAESESVQLDSSPNYDWHSNAA